jgi:hypothetical protein
VDCILVPSAERIGWSFSELFTVLIFKIAFSFCRSFFSFLLSLLALQFSALWSAYLLVPDLLISSAEKLAFRRFFFPGTSFFAFSSPVLITADVTQKLAGGFLFCIAAHTRSSFLIFFGSFDVFERFSRECFEKLPFLVETFSPCLRLHLGMNLQTAVRRKFSTQPSYPPLLASPISKLGRSPV